MKQIVKNGVIHDAVHPQPYEADLLLEGGSPFAIATTVRRVLIGGKTVHQA